MKIFAALLLAVACVHANSIHRYGWAPGTESIYRFESQVLTGIPEIRNSQYAGLKLMAQVRVQSFPDYTLRVKIEQPQLVTLNGEISLTEARRIIATGGPLANAKQALPQGFKTHLEEPVLVHLKRGLIENFFVSRDEPLAVTNIKRSLLAQLQLDVSGSQRIAGGIGQGAGAQGLQHKVVEESVIGKCHTMYSVIPMTKARVIELEKEWYNEETEAQLTPSEKGRQACEGKTYYEIIKTRDLDECHYSPSFQHVAGAELSGDVTRSHVANFQSRIVSSTTYVCGELSNFNIRKIVVDDQIVKNPVGYNTEQIERTMTRIMMELVEKKDSVSSRLPLPSQTRREISLVYTYPEQKELAHEISAEVKQKTEQILGTVPVFPQPGLTEAPKSLMPVQLPKNQIISKVVAQVKEIAREVFEDPESTTAQHDVSGKLLRISKLMQVLSLSELEQIWTQALAGVTGENRITIKTLVLDTVAMVGTNPSTMLVLRKVDSGEISYLRATVTIQTAMKSIQTPTKELLKEFIKMVRQWKNDSNVEKKRLLTPTLLQLSNLFYLAYINPSTMVSNFPVRIYGIFGTKDAQVLVAEYIPLLEQLLRECEQGPKSYLKPVVVVALAKLGHLEAVKPVLKVAQGINREEPMIRSLAVHSLKRVVKLNPTEMKPLLLALINNPVEHPDVRIAAIAVLPLAQPSFVELQKIAVRSWYETSNQVTSFARSTFESLLYTEVSELKPVSMKVKAVIHMFNPTHYGLQFSKNVHLSHFIEYLLGTVSTEASFTATKEDYVPSRIAANKEILVQVLGEGIRLNVFSTSLYTQGMEKAIDSLLRIRELAGDLMKSSPAVLSELKNIATEIDLVTRRFPEAKAFVLSATLGYEYAAELTSITVFDLVEQIMGANLVQKLRAGVSAHMVAAANIFSFEVVRPIEAGLPMIVRQDLPSVLAARASMKYQSALGSEVLASIVPSFNVKKQADSGIVIPFTEEHVGNGVTMAFHTVAPLESKITVKSGEIDMVLKIPQQLVSGGRSTEAFHGFVMPYTVRSPFVTVLPLNQATDLKEIVTGIPLKTYTKQFTGLINAKFQYESDNDFIDFYSYWQKIKQNTIHTLPYTLPLPSSVRKSSAKLLVKHSLWELKEVALKIRLWTQKPNALMKLISKPVEQSVEQEIQRIPSLNKAFSLLRQAPATIVKLEALVTKGSSVDTVTVYSVLGYNPITSYHVKPIAAGAVKISQGQTVYGILFEGELKRPNINVRWNKEQLLSQPLSLFFDGEVVYGDETTPQSMKKVVLRSALKKTQEQIRSVRASPEFAQCNIEERAGRRLSPVCMKVRHQAGSLDTAVVELDFSQEISQSPVLLTIESLIKAELLAFYRQLPVPNMPQGKVKLEMKFSRAGDVADLKVEHHANAYNLINLRIPYQAQGIMPLCARNPVGDWIEQRATNNFAPSSCRVEPEIVNTFDNRTYAYKINACEHVLLLDGSKTLPIAVMTKTVSGQQKEVKILSGTTQVEIIPHGGPSIPGQLNVKLNGQVKVINLGETVVETNPQTGDVVVEIKHFQDGVYHVYVAPQFLHVLTDGQRIEIIAPQLLRNRAVGLCGDMNGEEVADIPSPGQCIVKPFLAAMSYIPNVKASGCPSIPQPERDELKRRLQECPKDIVVPTPIVSLFERVRTMGMPVVAAHKVEKQMNEVCISKEKVKTCGAGSGVSLQGTMTHKTVKFACVTAPSVTAQALEKRAIAGESLGPELSGFSTAYTKMEAEPMYCESYGSTGGMGMNGNGALMSEGASGSGEMGYYSGGSVMGAGQGGAGMGGNQGWEWSGMGGSYGIGEGYGSSIGNAGSTGLRGDKTIYTVNWDWDMESQQKSLPDKDTIRMDKLCNVEGLGDKIQIGLQLSGPTWTKVLYRCDLKSDNADNCHDVLEIEHQQNRPIFFSLRKEDSINFRWMLGKAKTLGYLKPKYDMVNHELMKPGCSYLFTWIVDH